MTTADTPGFLGLTPEEAAEAKRRGALYRKRVAEADWHQVPKGSYAVPVIDWTDWEPEDGEPPVIGYRLFERKVARHCKTGRVIGQDAFITGRVMMSADADSAAVWREVESDRGIAIEEFGPGGDVRTLVVQLLDDVEDGDSYRAQFGKLTGKCGSCHKKLTDPKSKLLGLGPECRGFR